MDYFCGGWNVFKIGKPDFTFIREITETFASICLHASHPLRFLCTILWYNVETRIVMRFSLHSSKFPNILMNLKHIEIEKRIHV